MSEPQVDVFSVRINVASLVTETLDTSCIVSECCDQRTSIRAVVSRMSWTW